MESISAFVGIARNNTTKGVYSISVYAGGNVKTFPPKFVYASNKVTDHLIILTALLDFLEGIKESDLEDLNLTFYSNNDKVKEEWDSFTESGTFPLKTADLNLWDDIRMTLRGNLSIKGTGSILVKLNSIQDEKTRNALKGRR